MMFIRSLAHSGVSLGQGALPRINNLVLTSAAIGDAGRAGGPSRWPCGARLPALESLVLYDNPFGDEGLAALLAPPPQAGALPPPTGVLAKLKTLWLGSTQITDAGCSALASALDRGALPALETLNLEGIQASAAAKVGVTEALARSRATVDVARVVRFAMCLIR